MGINGERDIVDDNPLRKQQDAMGISPEDRPELNWLVDPNDDLRPIVFDVDDARWDKSHRHDH